MAIAVWQKGKTMRLIDADALDMYEALKSYYGDAWRDAQKEIDNAPTVDAEPVRHGQWEYVDYGGFGNWHCSHCREICITNGDYDYCPNCGARMDAERKDNGRTD